MKTTNNQVSDLALREIFNNAVDAMIVINNRGIIEAINPAVITLFLYQEQELIGQNVSILMPEPDRSKHDTYINNYHQTHSPKIIGIGREVVGKKKDGTEFPLFLSVSKVTLANHKQVFAGVMHDNSDLRKVQNALMQFSEELKKSNTELNTLNLQLEKRVEERTEELKTVVKKLEETNQSLEKQVNENKRNQLELEYREMLLKQTQRIGKSSGYVWNMQTDFVDFGDAFYEMLELKPEQAEPALQTLINQIHPDDRTAFIAYCQQLKQGGSKSQIELKYQLQSGKLKYIYHEGKTYFDSHKNPSHYIGYVQDITQRKQAEIDLIKSKKMFEVVAKNYPNGLICVYNHQLVCEFVEGQELAKIGLSKPDIIGKTVYQTFTPELANEYATYFNQTLQGQPTIFENTIGNNHYLYYTTPINDDGEHIQRIIVAVLNITLIKEAEEQIRSSLKKANELNELKSRFISMASHEFRTPLSTILSSLELMQLYHQRLENDKFNKHHQKIKSAINNLTEILEYFLSVEKLESGLVSLDAEKFDLVPFIKLQIADLEELLTDGKTITLTPDLNNLFITQDKKIIRTILQNLLSNAIKYSKSNGLIEVHLTQQDGYFELAVTDNGIGIPLDEQHQLFDRFYRAKNATNIQGTGIGLNLIKKYIELLQGKIWFTSQPNQGSTFWVTLPLTTK